MAKVRLMMPLPHSAAGGCREFEATGANLGEVFRSIAALHPDLGRKLLDGTGSLFPHIVVLLDGRSVRGEGLATISVATDSTVDFLEAMAGG